MVSPVIFKAEVLQLFLPPVKLIPLILFILLSLSSMAQDSMPPPLPVQNQADTVRRVRRTNVAVPRKKRVIDTSLRVTDSLRLDSVLGVDGLTYDTLPSTIPFLLVNQPVLKYSFGSDSLRYENRFFFRYTKPVRYTVSVRQWQGKEGIFYTVIGLLIFFAALKNNYRRYLSDLFATFFRTSIKQRQIKEQLLQNPLPSLLFNMFFIVSTAIFVALLFYHFNIGEELSFPVLAVYAAAGLIVIYMGKFILLKILGWIFQATEASDTYIFIVFSANKIIGIALLPFLVILAFTYGGLYQAAIILSLVVLAGIFLYRYYLAYVSIGRTLKIGLFHFLIYLAAFEVLPLLLINKLLVMFFNELH